MDLLVDIGNTSLKWARYQSGRLLQAASVRHHGALPIDLHAAWEQLPRPGHILIASVAAASVTDALMGVCRSRWGLQPELVSVEPGRGGVSLAYPEPKRMGVDRWLALIAARRLCAGAVLVVDAGTAVTYDLLLANGQHLGGLILPGIERMREALLAGTNIPLVEPEEPDLPWAADTGAALGLGTIEAPAALAERLHRRLEDAAGGHAVLLLTGGDAERLRAALDGPVRVEPDLVVQGLALLLE